jgi:hypothetical protein
MHAQQLAPDAPLQLKSQQEERIGRIVAVTGAHAVILIDTEEGNPRAKSLEMLMILRLYIQF